MTHISTIYLFIHKGYQTTKCEKYNIFVSNLVHRPLTHGLTDNLKMPTYLINL